MHLGRASADTVGRMRRRFAVALLGLCGLLAGCAGTVTGAGQPAANATRLGGGPSASATPGPSASASPDGGRQKLSCSGAKISPAGSPYCFVLPAAFQDASSSVRVDASIGKQEKYLSAVAVSPRDLITVSVYELRRDTDDISDDTLDGELKQVLQQLTSQQGFTFESTSPDKTTVDGARTFRYHGSQDSSGLESDIYFLFRGRNELQVNCQWKDKESDITRGCKSVLDTLQFKTVS
jgi:predicted small secreted protein